MIEINPQPESNPQPEPSPIREYGFTREEFSLFLRNDGFLHESDSVHSWKITDRDFFEFNVVKRR